jgi:aspartyl-tRNA(Asn)/glutamyl-tRNA(Gln) amidotransferase subunit A
MLTLTEAAEQIRTRQISPLELTRYYLRRIERLNPILNAFITVTTELALQQAQRAESEIMASNWRGPLHGVPIAIKDLFDTAGIRTTAASNQYRDRVPTADSEMVQRLGRTGAVLLGKLNLHEFAFGVSGIVSAFGPTRNPWDTDRITGGSSSGSAAAVAAGLCVASIGTDTAGSVRCPAALCGIVGFRPSAGVLGSGGAIPLATPFDTAGPLTRTVGDTAVLLDALTRLRRNSGTNPNMPGFNPLSPTSQSVRQLKIGIPRTEFFADASPEVATCFEEARKVIGQLVGEVRDISLEVSSDRTVFNAEIYEFHEPMFTNHPGLYDPRTLSRIRNCQGISASQYIRGLREVEEQRYMAKKAVEGIDAIITPTVLIGAPLVSDLEALGTELRTFETKYILRNTAPFSKLYWPSISVPCGFTPIGLPVGLQISARPGADLTVLSLAHAFEQATEWHKHLPQLAKSA